MTLAGRSLTRIADLSNDEILAILDTASAYAERPRGRMQELHDRIVAAAFFEPSTRTRLSFETASHRLGASIIGFADGTSTSSVKGESLEDTVKVLSGYGDLLVLRHPEKGAAERAARVSDVPVINAGDGSGEHPTQTFLDLYTMRQNLGELAGRRVAVMGDLRYGRTVHSLVPALQGLGAEVVAVPAPGLSLPDDVGNGRVPEIELEDAAATSDVLYVTRVQKERMTASESADGSGRLVVDGALLARTKSRAIVMHPLPRVDEISVDVDSLPSAKYFEQARNAVPVRMSVLSHILGESA